MPFVQRTERGNRAFTDEDLEWIGLINCLKGTGMSVKQIRDFIALCIRGDETLEERRQLFVEQRERVLEQIEVMRQHLERVEHKIHFYEQACADYERRLKEKKA